MNIPPGINPTTPEDGTCRYRVRIRIKGHKPVSKNFKSLTHAKQWKRVTEGQIEKDSMSASQKPINILLLMP